MRVLLISLFFPTIVFAQSNWYKYQSTLYNTNTTDTVYRTGSLALSHAFKSPYNNRLMVTSNYDTLSNRGQYISLNEPRYDLEVLPLDSSTVGIATEPEANYQVLILNNYANFQSNKVFTDVHNTTFEANYKRGNSEELGFRDGGTLNKAATSRFSASFGNNARAYKTGDFDLINLRLFTATTPENQAQIENFYALRMEPIRGVNTRIIKNGWGIYIQPSILNNYFAGKVGIGTNTVSHALTVNSMADPMKLQGLRNGESNTEVLTIDSDGVVKKNGLGNVYNSFLNTIANTTLTDDYAIYVHSGGDAIYTLPPASSRTGKIWQIVNVGSGTITTSLGFYEGDTIRNTILNKSGAYSYRLFSDGNVYISL